MTPAPLPAPSPDDPEPDELLNTFRQVALAVGQALAGLDDWGLAGTKPGQYRSDLVADQVAVDILERAGLGVLSEESGLHHPDRPILVALDPVDGSTNASRHLPWWATSLCALDQHGPLAALVVNQATGTTFEAIRGGGARRDGEPIAPSTAARLGDSLVAVSGLPERHLGWRQFRALGAAALDLCEVACGGLDGYLDCSVDAHGPWDYLGGLLVCREAGALVVDAHGRELVVRGHANRRTPVAGATAALLDELVDAMSSR
ncbi:MAG: monophosphatase [Acidimicrobiaceae bacterium]|jgi:fructose-1,6-bisphosphatase/inositol monophosphatase family enzyme|nr:monophosphatase [Acidimicrobiaceae bacterium]